MIDALTLTDLAAMAEARLPKMAWDYYASGADEEVTLRRNVEAFRRLSLHYRVLVDVGARPPHRAAGARSPRRPAPRWSSTSMAGCVAGPTS